MRITEIFTGRMRPRHRRFRERLEELSNQSGFDLDVKPPGLKERICINGRLMIDGIRDVGRLEDENHLKIIHQALYSGNAPYIAEFDLPLGVHGYRPDAHRRSYKLARKKLEDANLQHIVTFSDWARRCFGLFFGKEVYEKTFTLYPLASKTADISTAPCERFYDFVFVATQFSIKCGPQVVRSFSRVSRSRMKEARLCIVTNLREASRCLQRCLDDFPNVYWFEAGMSSEEVGRLLANSSCLVHPSLSDSFGVVVIEALAAGCAIIAPRYGSFPELVSPGNGYLIDVPTSAIVGDSYITEYGAPGYHKSLIDTLNLHTVEEQLESLFIDILDSEKQTREMMLESRRQYEQSFSHEIWGSRMKSLIKA